MYMHNPDTTDFIEALTAYVREALRSADEAPEYNRSAVRIADARNHIFRDAGYMQTDEEADTYALRDLCRVDEVTLSLIPDAERINRVARNYFY